MKAIELADFLKYRFLSGLSFAPGGRTAAFFVRAASPGKNGYDTHLWLYRGGKPAPLTEAGDEGFFCWEDEEHLLFPALRTEEDRARREAGEHFTVFYRAGTAGGEVRRVFELPFAVTELAVFNERYFVALGKLDMACPDYHLLSRRERLKADRLRAAEAEFRVLDELPFRFNGLGYTNKTRNAIFLVDRRTHRAARLSAPDEEVGSYAILDGRVYYCAEAIGTKKRYRQKIWSRAPGEAESSCLYGGAEYQIESLLGLGDRLVFIGGTQRRYGYNENPKFYEVSLRTGGVSLFSDNPDSLYPAVVSDCRFGRTRIAKACGGELYYLATIGTSVHLMRVDARGHRSEVIREVGTVDDFDVCEECGGILAVGLFDGRPQELFSFSKESGRRRRLSSFNVPALRGKYVAGIEHIPFSFGPHTLDGWLLRPKDYNPNKAYPGILTIHGGPKMAFGEVFYHEMQVWAGRGYFVFFCNPVGSDGRGDDFVDMRGKYGTADYESLMTFTDAVLERVPQLDPARLAVTGGSYGGFMTNWIIGHTNRFACAVSQRSISNWVSFYGCSDLGYDFSVDQMGATIFDGADRLWDRSPLKYAGNVETPTLFLHSDEDYRCPLAEGLQLYTALADRGVPTRMCIFRGENHELSRSGRPKQRLRRLREITDWIEKYTRK